MTKNEGKKEEAIEKKIAILPDVEVKIDDKMVTVKGKKGELKRSFSDPRYDMSIDITLEDKTVVILSRKTVRKFKAFVGTIVAHINNMMLGVSKGFRCEMAVVFTHFPVSFSIEGRLFHIKNFLGEKGSRTSKIIGDVTIKAEKTKITITGINKEDVGQTASNIEHACHIKNKDRRTFQDGCYIVATGVDDETFVNKLG